MKQEHLIDNTEVLKNRIEALEKEKKLNVQRIANKSGISKGTIYSVVKGRSKNPSINTIKAIADGFEMPLNEFLDFYPFNSYEKRENSIESIEIEELTKKIKAELKAELIKEMRRNE